MQKAQRILILFVVLFICVGCDQATKSVAQTQLIGAGRITYLNDTVRLEYAENPGAFLSLGASLPAETQRWVFIGFVTLLLLGMFIHATIEADKMHVMMLVAFALFIGGGLGNLIDRLINDGRVIDFMNVGVGGLRTGVFNVADMAIMAGVGLIAIFGFRARETDSVTQNDDKG